MSRDTSTILSPSYIYGRINFYSNRQPGDRGCHGIPVLSLTHLIIILVTKIPNQTGSHGAGLSRVTSTVPSPSYIYCIWPNQTASHATGLSRYTSIVPISPRPCNKIAMPLHLYFFLQIITALFLYNNIV